jgi:Flp pilus assembly protein, pilin Flp
MTLFTRIRTLVSPVQAAAKDRRGITALEYGLAAALVALVIIGGAKTFGTNVSTLFTDMGSQVTGIKPTL